MAAREAFDFSRHNDAAVRTYLQHWMMGYRLGYLIHPSVKLSNQPDAKVMDVACGTGIWLVDAAAQLPKTVQLDGSDVSSAHFPSKTELPPNVNLTVLNMFEPFPTHLHGQYDLVHVRAVSMYVENNDPGPILKNVVPLLKPGGYLQWEDLDVCGIYFEKREDLPTPHSDRLLQFSQNFLTQMGRGSGWMDQLPALFQQYGIKSLDSKRLKFEPGYAKPWTAMQLMANQDFVKHEVIPATANKPGMPSETEWMTIVKGIEVECEQGLRTLMDMTYTVGIKE